MRKNNLTVLNTSADQYLIKAKQLVIDYRAREGLTITPDQVYIVWFTKTLQHWKALVSTTLDDSYYYELTHNGDRLETYLDMYVKTENVCLSDIHNNK